MFDEKKKRFIIGRNNANWNENARKFVSKRLNDILKWKQYN